MASRDFVRLDSVLRSVSSLVAAVLLMAPVAGTAATLSQVRIGTHEDHTRIVLELDEAASYRLTPPAEGSARLQIQLDAESAARHVASRSPFVKAVRVTPSARGSTVSVELSQAGIGVSEMILADPPRIVLDLAPMAPPSVAQTTPEPAPAPAPPAAPPAAPAAAPAAAPETEAAASPSLSDPVPSDIAETLPPLPAEPEAAADPEPTPAARAEEPAAAAPTTAAKDEREGSMAAAPAPTAPKAADKPLRAPAPPKAPPAEVIVRKPAAPAAGSPASAPAATDTTWVDRLLSPVGYAAIGMVLLVLVVLAVRRRRHDEDDDPLYSVMSADDAGADRHDEQAPGVEWEQRDAATEAFEDPNLAAAPSFFDDEPVERDGAQQLSLAHGARATDESDESGEAQSAADSFLRETASTPLAVSDEPATSFEPQPGDATQLAAELGDRVQELERRLEQLSDARERLERQVAAQTEELRVQRAAIARTQRVVRSITKGEELATEPVPKAP